MATAHGQKRAAGQGGLAELTFYNSATSITPTITIPASAPGGSIAILIDAASQLGTPTTVNPNNNWTVIGEVTAGSVCKVCSWYRILDADDESDVITGMDSTDEAKVMLVFTGDIEITGAVAGDVGGQATSGNPTLQNCDASVGNLPLIVIGVSYAVAGTAAFSTASPAFDATVATSNADLLVGYKIYNSSPQAHDVDMNDLGGGNGLVTFYLVCS